MKVQKQKPFIFFPIQIPSTKGYTDKTPGNHFKPEKVHISLMGMICISSTKKCVIAVRVSQQWEKDSLFCPKKTNCLAC